MWNINQKAVGCSIREKLWIFDLIQALRARAVERYFVNFNGSVVLSGFLHVPAELTSEKPPDKHWIFVLFMLLTYL